MRDNRPAFPVMNESEHHQGLTRRELFAALAMQGILSDADSLDHPEQIAGFAVDYADALIAELDKPEAVKGDA